MMSMFFYQGTVELYYIEKN